MNDNNDIQFASDLRNVITRLIKKLRKESPTGSQLSLTERSTMALLYQNKEMLPSELAAAEMITNQSMSQVLNHLSELGYIIRRASTTDKRKVNISLSEHGESTLLQFRHERDEWLANAIAKACAPDEQEVLRKVIAPLNKVVDLK
ncbi:MarR family winged helix-turn-helix transcriptional regulator [Mucilaginibacter sp. OK098]|uniref:MarR family winged helix-turn-helix transcriptional regulator n=1 Tax=Mucilaginibacter sp. OK098 TaxID=1855297 RepID=UPI00090F9927|nr:MarR family transcriptional regulator [Mucilaginibacter sp. OK098]SHM83146.1 DNA-binding transcriptional regulator, MarR family [Mucilaginibacter sp. OK098]